MLVIAWTMLKNHVPFDPNHLSPEPVHLRWNNDFMRDNPGTAKT
jgi:hypothetical protein